MLPSLLPLHCHDRILIEKLADFVQQNNCFAQVNDLLAPFIEPNNSKIVTRSSLVRRLESVSNAVFNYIMVKCRELPVMKCESMQSAFSQWSELKEDQCVRFVWLLIDETDIIVLNKSSDYYDDISLCLGTGWYFKPSLDYVESKTFEVLTYEVSFICDHAFPTKQEQFNTVYNQSNDYITWNGIRYSFEVTGACVTLRMPWRISDLFGEPLYIFYTKQNDNWFYSTTANIQSAYGQM